MVPVKSQFEKCIHGWQFLEINIEKNNNTKIAMNKQGDMEAICYSESEWQLMHILVRYATISSPHTTALLSINKTVIYIYIIHSGITS